MQEATNLREYLFKRFVAMLLVTFVLLGVNFYIFALRPATHDLADASLRAASSQGEIKLRQYFSGVQNAIVEVAGLRPSVNFDRKQLRELDRHLVPIMLRETSISRIIIGDDSGRVTELSHAPGGTGGWVNTLYDPTASREKRKHELTWDALLGGVTADHSEASQFDGRQRPWYLGAVGLSDDAEMYWTDPYQFFTLEQPGITVSTRWVDANGKRHVVALDLLLTDISRFTTGFHIGDHGKVAVLAENNNVVLGAPAEDNGVELDDAAINKLVASPATSLSVPELMPALSAWHRGGQKPGKVVHYSVGAIPWLADFRELKQNNRTYWIAAYAPRTDFLPSVWRVLSQFIVAGIVILILAGFATHLWIKRFEKLAGRA